MRNTQLTTLLFHLPIAMCLTTNAAAAGRVVDLELDYQAASTVDPNYNPSQNPDMDGDGSPDLTGQTNIQTLLDVLADDTDPDHAATLASFEQNESLAQTALAAQYGSAPIVAPLAELWAVYMTIQGEGSYQGPTRTGMVGLVEYIWEMFSLTDLVGSLDSQPWEQGAIFSQTPPPPVEAVMTVTGGGVVNEGDRVTFTVSPADALSYSWYKDGTLLSLITGDTLILDPVQRDDAGDYYCVVEVPAKTMLQTQTITLIVNQASTMPSSSPSGLAALAVFVVGLGLIALRQTA